MRVSDFLSHFPGFYIQTFDDKKASDAIPRREFDRLELITTANKLDMGSLVKLNAKEAGIFFTPNAFNGSRKAEDCIGINGWFIESDDLTKEEQWELVMASPLPPTLVIETGKSLHIYFLAKEQIKPNKANFEKIENGLIEYFSGDVGCREINRVLRIPGFYHNKKEPFLVNIWHSDWEFVYTEEEMMNAFPYVDPDQKFRKLHGDDLDDVKNVPIHDVLKALGIETKKNRVMIDGKLSSMTIPKNGNYVNRFSGKPGSGSTIDIVCFFKGCSIRMAIEWIRTTFNLKKPQKSAAKGVSIEHVRELTGKDLMFGVSEILNNDFYFTWGTKTLDDDVSPLCRGRYVIVVGETNIGKTAWAFHFAKKNAELGHRVLYLSLEMGNEGIVSRYVRDNCGISKYDFKNKNFDKQVFLNKVGGLPRTLFFREVKNLDSVPIELVEEIVKSGGYDMVFIDNFGFIEAEGRTENEEMKNISRAMVRLTRDYNITIVALHHFRKSGDGVPKIRNMNAILGSGKIGHDVNFSVQVFRDMDLDEDSLPEERAKLNVIIQKDRDWGDLMMRTVYFKNGEFHSSYF